MGHTFIKICIKVKVKRERRNHLKLLWKKSKLNQYTCKKTKVLDTRLWIRAWRTALLTADYLDQVCPDNHNMPEQDVFGKNEGLWVFPDIWLKWFLFGGITTSGPSWFNSYLDTGSLAERDFFINHFKRWSRFQTESLKMSLHYFLSQKFRL